MVFQQKDTKQERRVNTLTSLLLKEEKNRN